MKKYLISTLTAAVAMAVPAFSAELIGSWDFTTADNNATGTFASTAGSGNLVLSTGSSVVNTTGTEGYLNITPAGSTYSNETTVDISSLGISTDEGISVVITITGLSSGQLTNAIWSAITTSGTEFAAAIGETTNGRTGSGSNDRMPWFAGNGSADNVTSVDSIEFTMHYPMEITMTYIGDTLTLYMDGTYLGSATINDYDSMSGTINGVAIASWDGESSGNELNSLQISSVEIYRGDIMAAPEPSMFGLFFGLGAIALVATRRRKRA